MNTTFQMDGPERVTTGAMDRGLLAAKSVDQVRMEHYYFLFFPDS